MKEKTEYSIQIHLYKSNDVKEEEMNYLNPSSIRVCAMLLFLVAMFFSPPSFARNENTLASANTDIGCKICQDSCSKDNDRCQNPCESSNNHCQVGCGLDEQCKNKCAGVHQKCVAQCIKQRDTCWKGCPCN